MTCQPNWLCTGCSVSWPGCSACDGVGERLDHRVEREPAEIAAALAGGVLRALLLASLAKSAPPLQLLGDRLGRRLVVDQDVARVILARQRRDLRVVLRPQLGVLHRVRFQVFLQAGIDQHFSRASASWSRDLRVLVDAGLLGLVGGELHADELIEQLRPSALR